MSRDNNKTSSSFGFNKRFTSYFALLLIAPLIQVVAPSAASAGSANSVTISTVGASTWTVPSNVSTVTIAFYGLKVVTAAMMGMPVEHHRQQCENNWNNHCHARSNA